MTSRIIEQTIALRKREAIAPRIVLNWNLDNSGDIEFWVAHAIEDDGVHVGTELDKRVSMSPLRCKLSALLPRTFNVPVAFDAEGNVLARHPVPAMLVMGAIKQAFDELYSEEVVRLENLANSTPTPYLPPPATPEPSPEPTVTPTPSAT